MSVPVSSAEPTIRFYSEVTAPYYCLEDDGSATGLNVDIAKAIAGELNIPPKIEHRPWARAYTDAVNKPNVVLVSVLKTRKREPELQWLGLLHKVRASLVSHKGNQPITVTSLQDAKKYRIGAVRGYGSADYLLSQGFVEGRNLVLLPSTEQMWSLLYNNRLDLVVANIITDRYEIESLGLDFTEIDEIYDIADLSLELHIATGHKTDAHIVSQLKSAIQTLKSSGEFAQFLSKWHIQ